MASVGKRRDSWAGVAICRAAKKKQFPVKGLIKAGVLFPLGCSLAVIA